MTKQNAKILEGVCYLACQQMRCSGEVYPRLVWEAPSLLCSSLVSRVEGGWGQGAQLSTVLALPSSRPGDKRHHDGHRDDGDDGNYPGCA
jgi:hypothetical protein